MLQRAKQGGAAIAIENVGKTRLPERQQSDFGT